MKLKFVCVKIYVDHYEACIEFYRDILGFEVTLISEYNGLTELNTGEIKLVLLQRQNLKEILTNIH